MEENLKLFLKSIIDETNTTMKNEIDKQTEIIKEEMDVEEGSGTAKVIKIVAGFINIYKNNYNLTTEIDVMKNMVYEVLAMEEVEVATPEERTKHIMRTKMMKLALFTTANSCLNQIDMWNNINMISKDMNMEESVESLVNNVKTNILIPVEGTDRVESAVAAAEKATVEARANVERVARAVVKGAAAVRMAEEAKEKAMKARGVASEEATAEAKTKLETAKKEEARVAEELKEAVEAEAAVKGNRDNETRMYKIRQRKRKMRDIIINELEKNVDMRIIEAEEAAAKATDAMTAEKKVVFDLSLYDRVPSLVPAQVEAVKKRVAAAQGVEAAVKVENEVREARMMAEAAAKSKLEAAEKELITAQEEEANARERANAAAKAAAAAKRDKTHASNKLAVAAAANKGNAPTSRVVAKSVWEAPEKAAAVEEVAVEEVAVAEKAAAAAEDLVKAAEEKVTAAKAEVIVNVAEAKARAQTEASMEATGEEGARVEATGNKKGAAGKRRFPTIFKRKGGKTKRKTKSKKMKKSKKIKKMKTMKKSKKIKKMKKMKKSKKK